MAYNETAVIGLIDNQDFYNLNLGPFCVGIAAQVYMMGILTLQMWQYFEEYASKDNRRIKALVVTLFFASTFQCATDFYMMYDTFVTGYGRIGYWNKYWWSQIYELAWTAFIAALAQGFFLHRCWAMTRRLSVLACGILGMLVCFGTGLASSIKLTDKPYYTETAAVDLSYGSWDFYYFDNTPSQAQNGIQKVRPHLLISTKTNENVFQHREGKSPHTPATSSFLKSVPQTLSRIVRLTFETAALTSVIALLDLVVYITTGTKTSAFQFLMGKMYNHSVMVTLLARKKIRNEFDSNSTGCQGTDSGTPKVNPAGITVTRTQIRVTEHVEYPMKSLTPMEGNEEEDLEFHTKLNKMDRIV
ncbi:hypothetical protein B0H10DRAFT_2220722 [Mycena sp. CBHHK59/15]|nr:hypothetical protein B0H10DRAFT_2220722 [Mycena sp. CBHHK59/15]